MVLDLGPYGLQSQLGHEPLDLLVVDGKAAVAEFRGYPPDPVPRLVVLENGSDFLDYASVLNIRIGLIDFEIIGRSGQRSRFKQRG